MIEPPDQKMNNSDKSVLAVFLTGVVALLYQGAELLSKHSDWAFLYTPPGVGEIFFTLAVALGTVLAALFVDTDKLIDLLRRKP